MIKIEISNPDAGDVPVLRALLAVASGAQVGQEMSGSGYLTSLAGSVAGVAEAAMVTLGGMQRIAPEDNPSAGAPDEAEVLGAGFAAARGGAPNALGAPAPSTAAAIPSPTALAAPTPTSTVLSPALPIPAPLLVPAVPTAAAPAPAPIPAPVVAGLDLDIAGLPWDARIHAGTKRKNADGQWMTKRGTGEVYLHQVQAELRAVMGAAPAPNVQAAAPSASAPVPTPLPLPLPTPTPQALPPTTNGAAVSSFAQLLPLITAAEAAGQITKDQIAAALASVGCASMPALAPFPHLVPKVHAYLFPAG